MNKQEYDFNHLSQWVISQYPEDERVDVFTVMYDAYREDSTWEDWRALRDSLASVGKL